MSGNPRRGRHPQPSPVRAGLRRRALRAGQSDPLINKPSTADRWSCPSPF